jgi:hypothetical protein
LGTARFSVSDIVKHDPSGIEALDEDWPRKNFIIMINRTVLEDENMV